ncbi:hypothetical protein Taro_010598 [Colocasia esculenta]|uniref:Telomere-associated protein Rif1 N-terminal domain-containing protein n=1 Tax=Colocasia esculenta TaxID=4460 RepID=A0A843U3R7_COLES|nr:hypothetical protein [Colocasia esculenta]
MHPSSLLRPSLSPSFSLSRRCGEDMAAAGSATRQLEEIEATILRLPRPSTPLDPRHNLLSSAYAALLNLMRGVSSAADPPEGPSGLHALSLHCPSLIPAIISDIALSDEETAAQALKCLGFMVYHPALSSEIPGPVADQVVKALARLAVTTTMKAIYNLGVWCISVQQLDTSALVPHFDSLLQAIIHALDNPFAMKLATQLYEKMRETSEIWAPAIYRRLLSVDKKERDMSERCLLKIQSVLLPPSLTLSKKLILELFFFRKCILI